MSYLSLDQISVPENADLAGATFQSELDFGSTSTELLPTLLDQSLDCVKLISREGVVQYMNRNGLCAMEIDDLASVVGQRWSDLWPEEGRALIEKALKDAVSGPVRFDAFCPTAKGTPRWWDVSVSQVEDRQGRWLGYLSVSRDVTGARLAKEVAEISAAEMRHRLKNSYSMVAALLSSLARGNPQREKFVDEVSGRLSALGVAQTLFVSRDDAPCDMQELLPALLTPFDHPDCPISVEGVPCAMMDRGQADALALVLGELAVNSSKHGALSSRGSVTVTATITQEALAVRWSERSSRKVKARSRTDGQGLRLIERILSARRGSLEILWVDNGLDAVITLRIAPPE